MLYAALAQSPVLGGKVPALDSAAAEKMPGVRKVLRDGERRRGGRRSFLAGAAGAQRAEDHLGSRRQRAARQRRHPRAAEENRRGRSPASSARADGDVAAATQVGEAHA